VQVWSGISPFQLHLGLIVNRSQSASCHIATVSGQAENDGVKRIIGRLTMGNTELKQIESAINFSNLLETENRVNLQNLLAFLLKFREIYENEKVNLPYHIKSD